MQKMKFQFGDCKRQIDLSDVDFVLNYEQAVTEYEEGVRNLNRELPPSAQLERIYHLFFRLFNRILGEGSTEEMFGNKKSVTMCVKAFHTLVRSMEKYSKTLKTEETI